MASSVIASQVIAVPSVSRTAPIRDSGVSRNVRSPSSGFRGLALARVANRAHARRSVGPVRASEQVPPPPETIDTEKLVEDLKEKWDKIEDKPALALYSGGALLLVWVASAVVGAISSVPLLPKFLELVGVGYTGWFVYRYLLFKSSRKELADEIAELKSKVTGATGLDD
eukprot:TRINITY_DN5170_c0_g1_i1.p1 TRINITY_DN5170_c0_g1~~TRINITY_DN5170_c0_g1_i1.p1  ORF type:complete len:170 (-),score=35.26 TRINITY_DN5170_c0_g1_i1:785-1294(-)